MLPCSYSYKLSKWTLFENNSNHFEATIFTNVYTEEEAQEWWHQFNIKSNTTMRVKATCPKTGKVNTFKIYLRCMHQGRTEKPEKLEHEKKTKTSAPVVKRNTNCPAGMIVAIRRHIKYSRSKLREPVDPVHPCEIKIRFMHNHPTNEGESLRFKPVSKDVEEKLLNLYQMGHSPASALEMLKIDLQVEHGSRYAQVVTDRSYCPNKAYCYRLYYKHLGKDYSHSAKKDLIDVLDAKVQHYNNALGESCLSAAVRGSDLVIAVCTPSMKRAHSLPQCCDVVFAESYESSCGKEQGRHYVILLIALTAAGGLPLGAVLTTSNTTVFWKLGFQLLQELLPTDAFSCRGMTGPCAFLVENSDVQRAAFLEVWPDSSVVTCVFRLLQHLWRWLWDEKHNVLKDHRLYLLYLAKILLFAANDIEMNEKYQALCADNIAVHYPMYLQVIESLWENRHTWRFSALQQLSPLPGASNYYDAAAKAFKDKLFEQARTFNIVQLLNYLVTRVDSYYKIKTLDILNCKSSDIFRTYFPNTIPNHVEDGIDQVAGNYFLVPNQQEDGNKNTVDAELNVCSCPYGINGALCLHQYWAFLKKPTEMFKVGLCDAELRQTLSIVVTGNDWPLTSSQSHITHEIESLSGAVPNSSEFLNTEVIAEPLFIHSNPPETEIVADSMFVHSNATETGISLSQTSSDPIVSLPCSHEINSMPISVDSCNQDEPAVFVNAFPRSIVNENCATITGNCIDENVNQIVRVENNNVDDDSLGITNSSEEVKGDEIETENTQQRMVNEL